jgi:DNA-binding response OmpR family regulator
MKILVIEDEKFLSQSICDYLKGENFLCEPAFDYQSASDKIGSYDYDCIILDITLPGGSGLDILKELKRMHKTEGVIIVSARNSLDDKISGLQLGADDYLPKPFHMAELGARVQAIVRRRRFEGNNIIRFKEIAINASGKTVHVNNSEVPLTKKEFDLLLFLVANKSKVISKSAIAEHLSGDDADVMDNFDFVYAHIKNLKKKLQEAGCSDYIKTVYGLGYKFSV